MFRPAGANDDTAAVPPSEGNEARREGDRESERPIVPRKPGNHPEGPGGGKGAPVHGIAGEQDGRNADFW